MRRKSLKQARKDRFLSDLKKELKPICEICGREGKDLAHLLPKSTFPEHYTNPKNLVILCRSCHNKYDNDIEFRKKQNKLYERICSFDKMGADRYFKKYD